jgi:LuxR family maltose regulon positive regulatory protein
VEGSPPARDVLLATKLHVPRSRPGMVARPRLADQLDEGVDRGLVLVTAPAGYGKSVLLSDWAQASGQPVAWPSSSRLAKLGAVNRTEAVVRGRALRLID